MTDQHRGSSFDDFLQEEGLLEEAEQGAIKRVLAWQLKEEMTRQHITKKEMAARMGTSRSQLDRLLSPDLGGVTLETMERGAQAVGRRLRLELT